MYIAIIVVVTVLCYSCAHVHVARCVSLSRGVPIGTSEQALHGTAIIIIQVLEFLYRFGID